MRTGWHLLTFDINQSTVHRVSATHKNLAEELLSCNLGQLNVIWALGFRRNVKIWIIHNPSNTLEVPRWLHQRYLGTIVPVGISQPVWSFQQMEEHCIKDILSTATSKKAYTQNFKRGTIELYMDFAEGEMTLVPQFSTTEVYWDLQDVSVCC